MRFVFVLQGTLSMNIEHSNDSTINGLHIESIFVMGVQANVNHVYIGDTEHKNISYNSELKVIMNAYLDKQLYLLTLSTFECVCTEKKEIKMC